jgi:metal-responsive CopG/Arc/MetJ family transcriptional regulator
MGRLKEYTFKADPRIIEELDRIAREVKTSRGALIRTAILNFIIQYHQKKEPKKMRVVEL